MPVKTEMLHVAERPSGWVVSHHDGREQSGPHSDRERAMASALLVARESGAQHVKVSRSTDKWTIECTYEDRLPAV